MTTATASLPLDSHELRQAISIFGADVLGGWGADAKVKKWAYVGSGKGYRARTGRAVPSDVLAHLTGQATLAIGPITRAIVIDGDLTAKGTDATPEQKATVQAAVDSLLADFDLPALHFDSARGLHTWLRCTETPTQATLDAFERALTERYNGPGSIEVYPKGGKAIRLPWGMYGVERRAVPELSNEELLRWLAFPVRATVEQLAALTAAFPPPRAERPQAKKAVDQAAPALEGAGGAPTAAPGLLLPPAPCTGWENWPVCKQIRAIKGPQPSRRHHTLNMLACEAVVSGERNEEKLRAFLLAVPRPHSQTPAAEHRNEVFYAGRDALALHAANDPRRFSSCPRVPRHSGNSYTALHRSTFEHVCDEEKAAACTIHRRWQREQFLPAYDHITHSSIWRSGNGAGQGLGHGAKAVYRLLLHLSGGDSERQVAASTKYIAIKLLNDVALRSVSALRQRLLDAGLIEKVEGRTYHFRVPLLTPAAIAQLEARLGTDILATRARDDLLERWDDGKPFQP